MEEEAEEEVDQSRNETAWIDQDQNCVLEVRSLPCSDVIAYAQDRMSGQAREMVGLDERGGHTDDTLERLCSRVPSSMPPDRRSRRALMLETARIRRILIAAGGGIWSRPAI